MSTVSRNTAAARPAAAKLPAFDGKYTEAPSLEQVKAGTPVKVGHEGKAVKHVQDLLHKQGYLTEKGDGFFGPKTQAAVDKFQKDKALKPSKGMEGAVGPTTLAWLENGGKDPAAKPAPKPTPKPGTDGVDSGGKPAAEKAPSLADVKKGGNNLRLGMKGESVTQAQGLLVKHGFMTESQKKAANGTFDATTKSAVAAFQKAKELNAGSAAGSIGPTTLSALEKAPRQEPTGAVRLAPKGASMKEKFDHYAAIVKANGGQVNPNGQATVLGVRGMDSNGNRHATTLTGKGMHYDDVIVVLKPNGTVLELPANTHGNQSYQRRAPDANGDGRGDLGMIRPGNYSVVPNGQFLGNASFHVRTTGGSGRLPGYRDTNQDGMFSEAEKANAVKKGYVSTEILFHRGGSNHNWSMGCQTLNGPQYDQFLRAVGGKGAAFNYSLVDANEQK